MNRLDRHIEILLLSNDCVIVPGLGGFMAHYVPARYDLGDNMFIPPTRTLGFNPQLIMNDSLLAQAYIESYDISYPEAIRRIDEEVNELLQQLELDGEYNLMGIGRLFYNVEGKIEFTPCDAGILTPALYGLSAFEIKHLTDGDNVPMFIQPDEPKEVRNVERTAEVKSPYENASPTEAKPEITSDEDDDNEERPKAICIPLNALRYTVAAACLVIALMLFPPQKNEPMAEQSSICNKELKIERMPKAEPVVKKKEVVKTQESEVKEDDRLKEVEPSLITEKPEKNIPNEIDNNKTYHTIILASKVTKANAEAFVEALNKKGIKAEVFTRNSIVRVISGKYNTEAEAYNTLRQMREKTDDAAEAWIMEINN